MKSRLTREIAARQLMRLHRSSWGGGGAGCLDVGMAGAGASHSLHVPWLTWGLRVRRRLVVLGDARNASPLRA